MDTNPSVLIVAYHYPPSGASAAPRPFRFATNLPETGCVPSVVAVGEVESVEGNVMRAPENGKPGFRKWLAKAVTFLEIHILHYRLRLPWVLAAVGVLRRSTQQRFDIVHSVGPPFCVHLVAYWVKRARGSVWVADMQDPIYLPEGPATSLLGRMHMRWSIFLERFLVQHADVVIANTLGVRALLQERFPGCRDKIEHLPNGFDLDSRLSAAPIPVRNCVVLAHYGDLYSVRHPAKLLESLDRLVEAHLVSPDRFRVELVGEGDNAWAGCSPERRAELLGRPWVRYVPARVTRKEANQATAEADYLLLLDVQGPLAQAFKPVMPAKIYDYVTVGRPVLCFTERGSPADELLAIAGIPNVIVYYDDSPAITDRKVRDFFTLPRDPTPPSARFEQEYSGKSLTIRLAGIYRTALQARRK